jgi:hypothetical protein
MASAIRRVTSRLVSNAKKLVAKTTPRIISRIADSRSHVGWSRQLKSPYPTVAIVSTVKYSSPPSSTSLLPVRRHPSTMDGADSPATSRIDTEMAASARSTAGFADPGHHLQLWPQFANQQGGFERVQVVTLDTDNRRGSG